MSASSPFQPHPNFFIDSTIFQPNTPSNNKNISMGSSSIVTDSILKSTPSMDKKRKLCNKACSPNSTYSMKEMRVKREKKMKEEQKGRGGEEQAPAGGYIHVRARRGQATDSHSLAERVRRERISARMKFLQALVPGCDKVNGKALMLDEIINYVQSLQRQVQWLSMKLASVNPMFYDIGMNIESFMVQFDQDLNNYSPLLPSLQEIPTYDLHESFALVPSTLRLPEVYK